MNKRQSKKLYRKKHGYNPCEAEGIMQFISDTIEYTEQRMAEEKKERSYQSYRTFLENIRQRRAKQLESIGKTEVFYCPNDEAVRARIAASGQKYHHVTGKKTKGHGGS